MAFEMHFMSRSILRHYDKGADVYLFWASTVPSKNLAIPRGFQSFKYKPGGFPELQAKQLDALLKHCIAVGALLSDEQKVHVFIHNENLRTIILANGSDFGTVKFMSAEDCAKSTGHETVMSELSSDIAEHFQNQLVRRAKDVEYNAQLTQLRAQQKKLLKERRRELARQTWLQHQENLEVLNIGTDGSYHKNFGKGTFAWVSENGEFNSGVVTGHNGVLVAELTAIVEALKSVKRNRVRIHSDSLNAVKMINNASPVSTKPHIRALVVQAQELITSRYGVEVVWVKGHAGHPLNDAADRISRNHRLGKAGNQPAETLTPILRRIAQDTRSEWKKFISAQKKDLEVAV